MTCETVTTLPPPPEIRRAGKKQASIEEIMESFMGVGDDIEQIGKLISKENLLVAQFFKSLLKYMQPLATLIDVSKSVLPFEMREVTQAHIEPTGRLVLTFKDGHMELRDLSEIKNRDLMMAVIGDVMPKLNDLASQSPEEGFEEPAPVQEIPEPQLPAPEPLPIINDSTLVGLPDSAPAEVPVEAPVLSAEEITKISAVAEETLKYLAELGGQVFELSPVSMYFDDWMVNLRQVILEFESSGVICVDEAFTEECTKIFGDIEGELANRLLKEAELEASAKTLAENKLLLGEIDAGYAAQSRDLVVKGKSAIDFLINNVHHLEGELAELEHIKTSYLHPLKKMAKEQRQREVTAQLNAAKRRLALAVKNSAVEQEKLGQIDAEYAAQTSDLVAKRKSAIGFLTKNVHDLEEDLARVEQIKTSNLHPLAKRAKEQKQTEVAEKLNAAKKRLKLAEQSSGAEQEKLQDEYEKKKQAAVLKMQSLEKEIVNKQTDGSLDARQAATNALANAVKSLIQRKTAPNSDLRGH